jgi:hypothetical protein
LRWLASCPCANLLHLEDSSCPYFK